MAGFIIVITCLLLLIILLLYKLYKQKKDVYDFADRLERHLDDLLSDKDMEDAEDMEDTLYGKINEKLGRLSKVWKVRQDANRKQKETVKELISDISHQTKTPIANQKLYLEILSKELTSKRGQEYLVKMEKQIDKLDFLFQNMVKMSRLETGIILIKKEKEDLVQTLSHAVAQIVPLAAKKQIEISVDAEGKFPICHDRKWTEETIFNLLDNAVKYTEAGGKIHIEIKPQEIFTRLSIQDTGKGIATERQAQIFTRFYREPEVHEQEGIGIGLYLARQIMELQKGYIEVRSEVGRGAEFRLYFPNEG